MVTKEYEELKEVLKKPRTAEAMKEAAEAFRRYRQVELAKGKGSRPTLVNLGFRKTYPHKVPLDKVANELETDPEFYDLMRRVVAKEKS